jgi:hypothetical protein
MEGFMNRTKAVEYCFRMEGELELGFEVGERRVIRRGGVVVQRGCVHLWRNLSKTKAARLATISVRSREVVEGEMETESGTIRM